MILSVKLPESLIEIGKEAFANSGLIALELPRHLRSIGEMAFYQKNFIRHIDIPDTLTLIGDGAFGLTEFKTVAVSDRFINKLGIERFKDIFKTATLTIDFSIDDIVKTLKDLGNFAGTIQLYEEQVPQYLRPKIAKLSSKMNFDIKYVKRPPRVTVDSVSKKSDEAFEDETFVIKANVLVDYNYKDSWKASKKLTERVVEIPYGVEEVSDYAFKNVPIACVKIPDTVKKIGREAFANCGLKKVYLPKSIEIIDEYAFHDNYLTSIEIPENIKRLGEQCFVINSISTTIASAPSYGDVKIVDGNRPGFSSVSMISSTGKFVVDNSSGKAIETIEKFKTHVKPSQIVVVGGKPLTQEEKSHIRSLFGLLVRISEIEKIPSVEEAPVKDE